MKRKFRVAFHGERLDAGVARVLDPVPNGAVDDQSGAGEAREHHAHPEDLLRRRGGGHPVGEPVDGGGLAVGPALLAQDADALLLIFLHCNQIGVKRTICLVRARPRECIVYSSCHRDLSAHIYST